MAESEEWQGRIEAAVPTPGERPYNDLANRYPAELAHGRQWVDSVARPALENALTLVAGLGWEGRITEIHTADGRNGARGFSLELKVEHSNAREELAFSLSYDMSSATGVAVRFDPSPSARASGTMEMIFPDALPSREAIGERIATRVEEIARLGSP